MNIRTEIIERYSGPVEMYVTPCGEEYPTEYNNPETIKRNHTEDCEVCRIAIGKSKAKVLRTQDSVAKVWALGLGDTQSKTGNVYARGDTLYHYGTIAAIKNAEGQVFVNSQDWSSGFARVPDIGRGLPRLPLTSISSDVRYATPHTYSWKELIEIVDEDKSRFGPPTVFKIGEHYFLWGRDDQQFIAHLCEPVETVEQALESMKPEAAKTAEGAGSKVHRQGDLFFIPFPTLQDSEVMEYDKQCYVKITKELYNYKSGEYDLVPSKRLYRPEIEKTRHKASEVGRYRGNGMPSGSVTVVRGKISHPEHPSIKLAKWHWTAQAREQRAWTIHARGGGRGD